MHPEFATDQSKVGREDPWQIELLFGPTYEKDEMMNPKLEGDMS